jgi:tetratricopeptide (TPR) repeat protein
MILNQQSAKTPNDGKVDRRCAAIIIVGLICVFFLARRIDSHKSIPDSANEQEETYLGPDTVKRISLGFNGLMADWYWMRSLQYVGRKIINAPKSIPIDNLGQLNLKLLAPLLDATTTLDPEFQEPYQYAAVVLPDVDVEEAIRITRKGIDANPTAWRFYQHLGYIYWQQRDFQAASQIYAQGATLPGAPLWMQALTARMETEGGSRETAREIYRQLYEQAEDTKIRDMARQRLQQLDYLDQRDRYHQLLEVYKQRTGRCPASWMEIEALLRGLRIRLDSSGAPFDPAGVPYLLAKDGCNIELSPKSEILVR